jgi:hypothetical protein
VKSRSAAVSQCVPCAASTRVRAQNSQHWRNSARLLPISEGFETVAALVDGVGEMTKVLIRNVLIGFGVGLVLFAGLSFVVH